MKNPGFLTNGTIIVLKPTEHSDTNIIAVVVGRYEQVVEGYPEYLALPVVLNPDEEKPTTTLTKNETMASYISFFEDEVLSEIGMVKEIDNVEWVITKTIEFLINKNLSDETKRIKVKKLENTLQDALEEKNFIKFKWIISNSKLDKYSIRDWYTKLKTNKDFYIEYFDIKDKDIDFCITKLDKLCEEFENSLNF